MRVLGAGRGIRLSKSFIHVDAGEVETPAMAAGARRATRQGTEGVERRGGRRRRRGTNMLSRKSLPTCMR